MQTLISFLRNFHQNQEVLEAKLADPLSFLYIWIYNAKP